MKKKISKIIALLVIVILLIALYAYKIGTHFLEVKEYQVLSTKINTFNGFKIVHFSDLNYGKTTYESDLKTLVDTINNKIKPDLVVFTGNLVAPSITLSSDDIDCLTTYLSQIKATYGKYNITGYDDITLTNYDIIMENSGFNNLDERYDLIYNTSGEVIMISGLSSNLNGDDPNTKLASSYAFLAANDVSYSLLLMTEPDYIDNLDYHQYDLVLAGYTKGGLIKLPIIGGLVKSKGATKYVNDYYELDTTSFYISSGIGTSNFPFRLFNHPSFNFYRLNKKMT